MGACWDLSPSPQAVPKSRSCSHLQSAGVTAVGVSPRGGNDPGFHRYILSDDGGQVTEIESYQMKRGCAFEWGHSFVESYAPHLDDGVDAAAVGQLLRDPRTERVRRANAAPNAAGLTPLDAAQPKYAERVRKGEAGCLAPGQQEVAREAFVARLAAQGHDALAPTYDGETEAEESAAQSPPPPRLALAYGAFASAAALLTLGALGAARWRWRAAADAQRAGRFDALAACARELAEWEAEYAEHVPAYAEGERGGAPEHTAHRAPADAASDVRRSGSRRY